MKKLAKVTVAYLIASFASVTTGWVTALVWAEWFHTARVTPWLFMAVVWLAIVGIPSLFASSSYLLKLLGVKDIPWLSISHQRSIPVGIGSNLAHTVPSIPSLADQSQRVNIPEMEIRVGEYVISHQVIEAFLRQAWRRQRQNKDGLSRTWWVDEGKQLERGEYEAIIEVLVRAGVVKGRGRGRSGKLIMPPLSTLDYLAEQL